MSKARSLYISLQALSYLTPQNRIKIPVLCYFSAKRQFFPQIDVCRLLYMAYIHNYFIALWFSLDIATITSFRYTSLFTVLPCSDQYRIVSRCAYLGILLYLLWPSHIYKNTIRPSSTLLACLTDLEPFPML